MKIELEIEFNMLSLLGFNMLENLKFNLSYGKESSSKLFVIKVVIIIIVIGLSVFYDFNPNLINM